MATAGVPSGTILAAFVFLCSLNVVFVLVKSGFYYLSRERKKNKS
jgi:hypothetical protein